MIALQLLETKDFMHKLLLTDIFDHFCLIEASISTFQTVTIDGRLNREYYSSEEAAALPPYNTWDKTKSFCYELIRGRHTPVAFHITMTLSPANIENVLKSIDTGMDSSQVTGLLINFRFDGRKVICTTGVSLNQFTLDRRLEHEWDALVEKFLKKNQIIADIPG